MALDVELFSELVSKPVTFAVLKSVLRSRADNGWSIARKLNKTPQQVEEALGELKSKGILESESSSMDGVLDGIYYPTIRGVALGEDLKG